MTNPIRHATAYRHLPDHLLTVSRAQRERFITQHKVHPERVTAIRPGVDFSRFEGLPGRPGVRAELGLDPGAFVVAMVAAMRGEKDHPTMLSAFARVAERAPGSRLLLIGGERERGPAIRKLAGELGLTVREGGRGRGPSLPVAERGEVWFLGQRSDVPRLLQAVDVAALSSSREPLGNVLLEAFAARRPLVATEAEGPREIVEHQRTGLLTPIGEPHALAAAILRCRDEPPLARRMTEAGYAYARAHHDFPATVTRLEQVYAKTRAGLSRR